MTRVYLINTARCSFSWLVIEFWSPFCPRKVETMECWEEILYSLHDIEINCSGKGGCLIAAFICSNYSSF